VPELPDITLYLDALDRFVGGKVIERIQLRSPFVLRTVLPTCFRPRARRSAAFDVLANGSCGNSKISCTLCFPEKVTAFRPEMAAHGKYGQIAQPNILAYVS